MLPEDHMPHAFMSYVSEDTAKVTQLANDLKELGAEVWLDRSELTPGVSFKIALRKAIEEGNYFVACFSKSYVARKRNFMNEELNTAVDEIRMRPDDQVFFIPVKLNDCEVPHFQIRDGKTFEDFQYVELYKDWAKGIKAIARVINEEDKKK
jgi:hypothetical protein